MSERTDEEQGTEPETTGDWIRDLEGQADTPDPSDAPATPKADHGVEDSPRERDGTDEGAATPEQPGG